MKDSKLEKRALLLSAFGALLMTGLGVGFAIKADSEAILLDGVFSGIGFVMALFTLKVARLVKRPDDDHFHYGYAHFAPLLNVFKAVLILILCSIALIAAIDALFSGGRNMAMGSAVLYGILATAGSLAIALYIHKARNISGSALVAVDAQSWAIDTLLSAAVLIAFIIGWAIQDTAFDVYLPYLDPTVVAVLCLVSLPVPIKTLIGNAREVILLSPDDSWKQAVDERFKKIGSTIPASDYRIRLLKMGNSLNILVHVKPDPEFKLSKLSQLDDIRHQFKGALESLPITTIVDIVFVEDMKMAE